MRSPTRRIALIIITLGLLAIDARGAKADFLGYADEILGFLDSGAGPIPGPYGRNPGGQGIGPVSPTIILGPPPPGPIIGSNPTARWLALPTGSFVTVGFTDDVIVDGQGNDIFIRTLDPSDSAGERADTFISSDGLTFSRLGTANEGGTFALDLAAIGFSGPVKAVRVVGLDTRGTSPGFDLVSVQALNFQAVPEPGGMVLSGIGGLGLLGYTRLRLRTNGA
jgi:hypothetical protein